MQNVADATSKKPRTSYSCEVCDYLSCNKKDYARHLATEKHMMLTTAADNAKKAQERKFVCKCGKAYKQHQGLYRHKKTCALKPHGLNSEQFATFIENNIDYKQIIDKLIEENIKLAEQNNKLAEQNNKLMDTMSELVPKIGNNNTITTNNTITNNNSFNLQIFLNEDCKDAISMVDFVKSLEISMSHLTQTKNKGLAEGITNIFIEGINKLPITQRPIHCTDAKRETLYIKNETWEKDDDNKTMIKQAIKNVSRKQAQSLYKFKEAKPNYMENDNDKDDFIRTVKNVTDDIEPREDKVIKSLCKNVYINEKIIKGLT
jgi:hypothetical protein